MGIWNISNVPHHPDTRLRLACQREARNGRHMVSAYDGERLVYTQCYDHWTWLGHNHGGELMPAFIRHAEQKAAASE
ncbi:hypothetical protein KVG88_30230 [Pseudomonas sp. SWRI74]|uniref:Uncharacterized protein n=1 Tax=Pseudomonas azerbaijanoccidentalis TaxID=2842347 RepID=A0ABS6QZP8_9PSED|nr:hypothetical protein [Pseudomonas azerbaijanoccidentalis]MBV4524354.1 hypothetical protein [Pseudomonas azerbaijanoccidentalis]